MRSAFDRWRYEDPSPPKQLQELPVILLLQDQLQGEPQPVEDREVIKAASFLSEGTRLMRSPHSLWHPEVIHPLTEERLIHTGASQQRSRNLKYTESTFDLFPYGFWES